MKLNLTNTEIGTISTMADWGNKIVLYTPELSTEEMTALFMAKKQWIADEIEFEVWETKTPSQRLRNSLFILYEQQYKWWEKYKSFEAFYAYYMEKLIDQIKEKLN
jgi:hypothetical protein